MRETGQVAAKPLAVAQILRAKSPASAASEAR